MMRRQLMNLVLILLISSGLSAESCVQKYKGVITFKVWVKGEIVTPEYNDKFTYVYDTSTAFDTAEEAEKEAEENLKTARKMAISAAKMVLNCPWDEPDHSFGVEYEISSRLYEEPDPVSRYRGWVKVGVWPKEYMLSQAKACGQYKEYCYAADEINNTKQEAEQAARRYTSTAIWRALNDGGKYFGYEWHPSYYLSTKVIQYGIQTTKGHSSYHNTYYPGDGHEYEEDWLDPGQLVIHDDDIFSDFFISKSAGTQCTAQKKAFVPEYYGVIEVVVIWTEPKYGVEFDHDYTAITPDTFSTEQEALAAAEALAEKTVTAAIAETKRIWPSSKDEDITYNVHSSTSNRYYYGYIDVQLFEGDYDSGDDEDDFDYCDLVLTVRYRLDHGFNPHEFAADMKAEMETYRRDEQAIRKAEEKAREMGYDPLYLHSRTDVFSSCEILKTDGLIRY